ncbi:MAG: SUMF1/EgtB/PvdO family nonheme iron enzyme [Bacteroidota bacterium]
MPAGPGLVDLLVDVQWDGSWRNPHNWDAAWTFVKFRAPDGRWKHASLAPQGHVLSPQAGTAPTPAGAWTWAPDSTGLWLHRAAASSPGPNRWTARLRWAAGADGAAAGAEVRVLGLEMVYVPEGAFYAGDGVSVAAFEGAGGEPVRIDSTGTVVTSFEFREQPSFSDGVLGGEGVYVDGDGGINTAGAAARIDNAGYPTGYEAFYVGKYELTQGQYATFLTLLTPEQRAVRSIYTDRRYNDYRGSIVEDGDLVVARAPDRACNFLNWADGAAYLDWAGLRPMTELEYEKAARGDQPPVPGEYAWGTPRIQKASQILGEDGSLAEQEDGEEGVNGNATYGVITFMGGEGGGGPLRVGVFARNGGGDREASGASYYGVMELSGSLFDTLVSMGSSKGRQFQGSHGDGEVDPILATATNPDWPDPATAEGSGSRGGNFGFSFQNLYVSSRLRANYPARNRAFGRGIRAARTATLDQPLP